MKTAGNAEQEGVAESEMTGVMVRSRAHTNQWDVGLILPPTKKSALECLSKWNIPPSKGNLLLAHFTE